MAFEWLDRFQRETSKGPAQAGKALAAYRLGAKAGGAITGVAVRAGPGCCRAALDGAARPPVHPAEAPALPLPGCDRGGACRCLYRPVMSYQVGGSGRRGAGG
jgi:hypothetical protein